ncbi:carbamoyltransferase HypF [Arsenicibacter rosenii]|uniref:Carbamoyltransferase n=1 Tax=Arsenicibacter rosenii TaxID=1750698 RepID=A0A1S2VMJ2_9BACT|nr:carbamoyltransferase HypF [Arsenicibacter rosenii]OIN59435.1 carbamoyltransferase HypF [Arsenicibacter rosenii]
MQQVPGFCIHLNGLVQGVGFRPYVYALARRQGLPGTVSNGMNGVQIRLQATEQQARAFLDTVLVSPPAQATITRTEIRPVMMAAETSFRIVDSEAAETASLWLPADFSLCADCEAELYDPASRRFRYPFITCTQCGPRYSVIQALPYDRPNTTMLPFPLCPDCQREYTDPADRRFYAQTNACPVCGPTLSWYKTETTGARLLSALHDDRWILTRVRWALEAGNSIAVKAVGGFLLLCDARNETAVARIRQRKHRPTKPFALLYPSLSAVGQDVWLHEPERAALQSTAAPVVLLRQRSDAVTRLAAGVAPGLAHYGIMLPNAPLLHLIATGFGGPLVATSANISSNPVIYTNEKALSELNAVADYILTHDRAIAMPQDDSVVRFSARHRQRIVIRRGRGWSPNYTPGLPTAARAHKLAFGASLKGSFALQLGPCAYVSQYLGDVESYETQLNYRTVLDTLLNACLPGIPEPVTTMSCLLVDAHEGYASTQMGIGTGAQRGIAVRKVQHHEAHFAAVLAENNLLPGSDAILGVIWDGTGYGTDGHIWGGEFFVRTPDNTTGTFCRRTAHFPYFDSLLGDKMPREPRLSALSLVHAFSVSDPFPDILTQLFSVSELTLYQKILTQNKQKTSSIGRLFDGVAALLGLAGNNTYEGEAALQLEEAAGAYIGKHGHETLTSFAPDPASWIGVLLGERVSAQPVPYLAARFHVSLVEWIRLVAAATDCRRLAFSGGVFQNAVLVDLLIDRLGADHVLYFHQQLSPNDECISLGQLALDAVVTTMSERD